MTKTQTNALEAALLEEAVDRQRADKQSKVERRKRVSTDGDASSEFSAAVSAWEAVGAAWLKDGEALLGPNFDVERELRLVGRRYLSTRNLPPRKLSDSEANLAAGVHAILIHGALALIASLLAAALGAPTWACLAFSCAYVVWRFRLRREGLLSQRAVT